MHLSKKNSTSIKQWILLLFAVATVSLLISVFMNHKAALYLSSYQGLVNQVQHSQCHQVSKIGFLKVHKTGSSAVQNIILRHTLHNKLNALLPREGNHLTSLKHPNKYFQHHSQPINYSVFLESSPELPWHQKFAKNQLYDVMPFHTIWYHKGISLLLGPKAKYVTMIRHPADLFESLYQYFDLHALYKLNLTQYVEMLDVSKSLKYQRLKNFGLNHQLFLMGLGERDIFDQDSAKKIIEEVDQNFDLVMINEYFDASMVLMADLLCWPLEHVVTMKLNARTNDLRWKLTVDERKKLELHQANDMMMYDHFKTKFLNRLEEFGHDKMNVKVKELQDLRKKAVKKCGFEEMDRKEMEEAIPFKFALPFRANVMGFKTTSLNASADNNCKMMITNELSLVKLIRKEQLKRWKNSEPNVKA